MDTCRFDALTRRAAGALSRRSVLGGIPGAIVAATIPPRRMIANKGGGKGGGKGDKDKDKDKDKRGKKLPCQKDYNRCATVLLAACGAMHLPHDQIGFYSCLESGAGCRDLFGQCDYHAGAACLGQQPAHA